MKRTDSQTKLLRALLVAEDFHHFLRLVFIGTDSSEPLTTYADFARRAGIKSRSYPREVTLKTRALSLRGLDQFISGFRFSGNAREYFRALAKRDYPKLCNPGEAELDPEVMDQLKGKLKKSLEGKSVQSTNTSLYRILDWPTIYAALGSTEEGSTTNDIARRSRLDHKTCLRILNQMQEFGYIALKENRYFPTANHLNFLETEGEGSFKSFFIANLLRAQSQAKKDFLSKDAIYFCSHFSVHKQDLSNFSVELRQLLLKYVEGTESADGDRIASLVLAMNLV